VGFAYRRTSNILKVRTIGMYDERNEP